MKYKNYFEKEEYNEEEEFDIYSKDAREELVDDDEISDAEEAFMEGYENA